MATKTDETPIKKSEAIREAIRAGYETASTGIPYIKERYGIDVAENTFNSTKAQDKKRATQSGQVQVARRRQAADELTAIAEKIKTPAAPTSDMESMLAMAEVVKLVQRFGLEKVELAVKICKGNA